MKEKKIFCAFSGFKEIYKIFYDSMHFGSLFIYLPELNIKGLNKSETKLLRFDV